MQKPDTGKLIKLVIKEPTDKEFEAFKKDFLRKQAEKTMGSKVRGTIGKFLYKIGELESERDELKHQLSEMTRQKESNNKLREEIRDLKNKLLIEQHNSELLTRTTNERGKLLSDVLFIELKTGILYQ